MFGDPWPNVVYSNHDYALPGFVDGGPYPGVSRGVYVDRDALEQTFLERSRYMLENEVPVWVGEFGPVYPAGADHEVRYQILRDQLEIYDRHEVNWSIWLYKDIGLQGVTYADPDSPWMRRIRSLLEKKAQLGVDAWGGTDKEIRDIMEPLERKISEEFPNFDPFPFGTQWWIDRLVRNILLAEPLVSEFGELFRGMDEDDIEEMMKSFRFENCGQRTELADILSEHAPQQVAREAG